MDIKKVLFFAPALFLMACGGNETEETTEENETPVVEEVETPEVVEEVPEVTYTTNLSSEEDIKAYLEEKSWENETPHESGIYISIDNAGEGDEHPTVMDEVTIFYQGYLLDGTKFDGTTGNTPATFPLMQLIEGWQIGIPMFAKGGMGKLIIPSDLAYGDNDYGDIPGGSTLLFEIELIDWQAYM